MFNAAQQRRHAIEERRQLHARIARSRRRLDQQAARLTQGNWLPTSWRKQIQDRPIAALLVAAGAGALLAQFVSNQAVVRRAGDWLTSRLAGSSLTSLKSQAEALFASWQADDSQPTTEQAND